MGIVSMEEQRVKELFKQALLEVLHERKEMVYEVMAEVIEDLAMVNAIEEGKASQTIHRDDVMKILEGTS